MESAMPSTTQISLPAISNQMPLPIVALTQDELLPPPIPPRTKDKYCIIIFPPNDTLPRLSTRYTRYGRNGALPKICLRVIIHVEGRRCKRIDVREDSRKQRQLPQNAPLMIIAFLCAARRGETIRIHLRPIGTHGAVPRG